MRHNEQDLQIMVASFIRLQYPHILFSISPGGLLTSGRTGKKAQLLGYQAGTPDLQIYAPNKKYHGLFIELKVDRGKLSPQQKEYLKQLNTLGYKAIVCFNFEETVEELKKYLK